MILYFSGTGNSRYIAREAGKILGDEVVDMAIYTRQKTGANLSSDLPWVLVVPAYASYVPLAVDKFVRDSTFSGNRNVYMLMTCGGTFSRMGVNRRFGDLVRQKGLTYRGIARILMPENYITMFAAPPQKEADKLVANATKRLPEILAKIQADDSLFSARFPSFFTYPFNDSFYRKVVTDKHFYVTEKCVGCGKCQTLCPLANIKMVDGKPVWQGNCTQCMACICACPTQAVEYGNKTRRKRRYYLE